MAPASAAKINIILRKCMWSLRSVVASCGPSPISPNTFLRVIPRRQGGFHIVCHTYGSWMHRFGKLDRHGLARTAYLSASFLMLSKADVSGR